MDNSVLYPHCDFNIWFRSVNEDNVTETPIEGHKIGKKLTFLLLNFSIMNIP